MIMRYFDSITDFEQAKQHYRKLAKQLHPDKGGSPAQFQELQKEYQAELYKLQNKESHNNNNAPQANNEIIDELGKLAKNLLKTQIPQRYLEQRMTNSKSPLEKNLYLGIIKFLDEFK
jgi:hypothetical protein